MKAFFLRIVIILLVSQAMYAQKTIPLYAELAPNSKPSTLQDTFVTFKNGGRDVRFLTRVVQPELTIYLPEKAKATGIAVVICPGGGYAGVAIDHEGHDMAKKLQANGIAGFVLKYRLPNAELVENKELVPLQDAQRAIQIVRENAAKWGINPKKVGILGSSAGGHLASTAGTHYRTARIENPQKTNLRPDFLILNYPVISFADSLTHFGSRMNLVGDPSPEKNLNSAPIDPQKIKEYSNELRVDANTPPTFITHAVDDDVVKVENSLLFIAALNQNKVPVQSFFYAKGGHGYGMNNPTSDVDWFDSCIKWLLTQRNK